MIRHPIGRPDADLSQLGVELSARLGRKVDLVTQPATDDDPGVLICEDPETGEWLDIDPATVASAIEAHQPQRRARQLTPEEQALAAFDAAKDLDGRLAAFRGYLSNVVTAQAERREAVRRLREERARR